jgi:hypothetical protein
LRLGSCAVILSIGLGAAMRAKLLADKHDSEA